MARVPETGTTPQTADPQLSARPHCEDGFPETAVLTVALQVDVELPLTSIAVTEEDRL